MSRKARFILAVAILAGLSGYRYWRDHHAPAGAVDAATTASPEAKKPARTADAPPAKPRMYGRIAFTPCTLEPLFGQDGVEAQCGSYAVAEDPARPDGRRIALNIAWIAPDDD